MNWLPEAIQERVVIVLAHFVWQGVAIAALLATLIAVLNIKRPSTRYASSLVAFLLMTLCPVVTWCVVPTLGVREVSPVLDSLDPSREFATDTQNLEGVAKVEPSQAADEFRWQSQIPNLRSQMELETPNSISLPMDPSSSNVATDWRQTLRTYEPWIIGVWLCGVALLSLRLLCGVIGVWRWRRSVELVPESLAPVIERLWGAMSLPRLRFGLHFGTTVMPRVRVCRRVAEAVAIGLFKPMILLPAAWVMELPADMLEAVLAHELAHVRRLDLWVNLLQRLVETLLFYHPAVWWLSRRLRIERELCCDELAAEVTRDRVRYAETLEHVARWVARPESSKGVGLNGELDHALRKASGRATDPFAVAMIGREGVLLHRIRQLLGVTPPVRIGSAWLAGLLTLAFVLTLTLGTFVSSLAQGEKPTADKNQKGDRPFVLTFPRDRSVGEVATRLERDNGWSVLGRYGDWNSSIPAIGDVHIPAGHEVTLTAARDDADRSFEWLDQLPADGIRKLNLSYGKISEEGLRRVGRLTGLRELTLQGVRLTDAGVQHLATLTELRHLDLNGGRFSGHESRVSDESLRVLLQMPLLESLDLRGKAVTDAGMPYLARLTSLQDLSLSGTKVTDAGLAALEPLQSLLYLRLGLENFMDQDEADESKHFTDAALPHVAKLKKLQALRLGGCSITDDGLKALRGMPELVNLDLNWTKVTGSGFSHLAELPKLTLISPPSGCGDAGLAHLAKIRTLTGVFSNFEHVTDTGFEELAQIKGLARLSLGSQHMTNAGLRHIGAMPALRELILEGTGPRITVAGLAEFAKQSDIEWLALRNVRLTEPADGAGKIETEPPLQALRDFRNLKDLEIAQLIAERGPATELDLPVLAELQTLEHLSVTHRPMSPRTLAYASRMPKLKSFDFSENVVEDKDVANLRGFPSLRKLSLPLTRLTDTGLAALTRFTQLEELTIGGPITDAGLLALKSLPKLKYLEIGSPHVTAQGLSTLQAAMPSLKHARQFGFEVPESLDNRLAQSLRRETPLAERRRVTLANARLEYQRLLMVFVDERSPRTKALFSVLKPQDGDFEEFERPLTDYAQLWVSAATDEERTSAQRELQLPVGPSVTPSLAVIDAEGKFVASRDLAFDSSDQLDLKSLQDFLTQHMLPSRDTEELLRDALAKAKREDKRVLLQETGIGCYPCRLLSRFIEQHRDIFDEHFVWVKVDSYRWENGVEVIQRFRTHDGGIPWVAILDATGKKIGSWDEPDGENIGFPTEADEIDRVIKLLKRTAPRLTEKQIDVLKKALSNKNTRAGRGSPDPALNPTAGLPNSDEETNSTNNAIGDLGSSPARPEKHSAKLPNGVELELAGVAMANVAYSDQSQRRKDDAWWRADGTRLKRPPMNLFSASVDESQKEAREFAIKLTPPGDEQLISASYVTWTPSPPRGSSGVGGWDINGGEPGFLKLQHTAGFKDEKQVAVHVFVSDQPLGPAWLIAVNGLPLPQEPTDAKTEQLRKLIDIVGVEKSDNETIFRSKRLPTALSERLEFNLRAIDQKDQPHSSSESRGSEAGEGRVFKLAAADIKHFEIRLRPMTQRVTFENVSLVPGRKTDVTVKVEAVDPLAPTEALMTMVGNLSKLLPKHWHPKLVGERTIEMMPGMYAPSEHRPHVVLVFTDNKTRPAMKWERKDEQYEYLGETPQGYGHLFVSMKIISDAANPEVMALFDWPEATEFVKAFLKQDRAKLAALREIVDNRDWSRDGWGPIKNGLRSRWVLYSNEGLGKPITVGLEFYNFDPSPRTFSIRQAHPWRSWEVLGPDGTPVPFRPGKPITSDESYTLKASSSLMLFGGTDISSLFDLAKPGRYTLRFNGQAVRDVPDELKLDIPEDRSLPVAKDFVIQINEPRDLTADGLEFLKPYPKLHGLSLDMTEPQFLEIVKQQELKTRKTVDGEKVTHHIALGDDHTLIVMFDKDAKCSGIQRVRGEDDFPARPNAVLGRESFKGRVMIDGPLPDVPLLKLQPTASRINPRNEEDERKLEKSRREAPIVEIPDDSLVISKDGGLANVAIYLKKAPANWKPSAPPETPVELRSGDHRFQPRLSFVRVGQPIRLIAPKNEADNFMVSPIRSNTFNILVPSDSQRDVPQPFTKSEPVPIDVRSNLHPWQKAFLLAFDHPFAAITDADGRFEIRDLPAGEHHFTVWHERRGYLNKDLVVRVEDGKVTAADLKYTVEQLSPGDVAPPIQNPDAKPNARAGRGSPDTALDSTAGLPNSDNDTKTANNANEDLRSNPAAELEKQIQAKGRELFFGRMELAQEFEMLWPTKDQKLEKVVSKGTVRWLKNARLTRIDSDRMVPGTATTELHPEQWTTGYDGNRAYSWDRVAKTISYGAMWPGAVGYSPNLLFASRSAIAFPEPMFGANPKITRTIRAGREEFDVVQFPGRKLSIHHIGIAPDRGYLPSRVEEWVDNRLESQTEFQDFFQPHPGVWAPKTIVWTAWSADNDANGKPIVAMSSKFTVTKLELGERAKLQDEEFQLKLPDGVKEVDAATANAAAQAESVSNDKQLTSGIRTKSYTGPGQKLVFLEDGSVAFARGLGITHADILDDHSLRAVFHDASGASEMQTLKLVHGLDEQRQIAWSAEHNGKKYDVVATQHSPSGFLVRALISKDRKVLSGHQGFFAFELQKPRAQDAAPSNEPIPDGGWFDPKDGGKLAVTDSRMRPGTYVGVRQECRVLKGQKDVILNQLRPTRMTLKSDQTLAARFYDPPGNPQDIALKFLHGSGHARFSTWKSEIDDRVYKVEAILISPTTCTLLLETYSQGELLSAAQEFYAINSQPWPKPAKAHSIEEARILRELEAVTSIAFENVPFNEAIGLITKQHKLPIIIDAGQLQELKIKSDTPITLTMTDVKVRSVLEHILKLGGGDRLGYVVEDDALKIRSAKVPEVKALRGEILLLDRANSLVRISLGQGDAVQKKTTFEVRAKAPANDAAAQPVVKGTIEVTRIIDANNSEARILKENAAEPIAKGDEILLLESQPAPLPPVQGEIYDAAAPRDVSHLKPTKGTVSTIYKEEEPKKAPLESPSTKK